LICFFTAGYQGKQAEEQRCANQMELHTVSPPGAIGAGGQGNDVFLLH
jgi:hypothetical protein